MLPIFKTPDRILSQLQTQWAKLINPVVNNPTSNSLILSNVLLVSGDNVIDHKLGRELIGWEVVRIRSAASLYDTQDTNQYPELTLALHASAPVSVDLLVF